MSKWHSFYLHWATNKTMIKPSCVMAEESKQRELLVTRQLHHSRIFFSVYYQTPQCFRQHPRQISQVKTVTQHINSLPETKCWAFSVVMRISENCSHLLQWATKSFHLTMRSKHHLISRNPYKSRVGYKSFLFYFDFCSVQEQTWTQTLPLTYPTSAGPCL